MWIPSTAAELESAVAAGILNEGPHLDGKREFPPRNADLAKDVAAMATDGGVLVIGVGEDGSGRLVELAPVELEGLAERVDLIVQSSVDEPPHIEVRRLDREDEPGTGYLAVVVPPSPRAPHQVTVGNDFRYYGRGATGNRRLTEGEVARLYARRERWEVDREALLNAEIEGKPYPANDLAYAYAFINPVAADRNMLSGAAKEAPVDAFLRDITDELRGSGRLDGFSPHFVEATMWIRRGATGWFLSTDRGDDSLSPRYTARVDIDTSGAGHLFLGRAAERHGQPEALLIFEGGIIDNLAYLLDLASRVYEAAGFLGSVDVGIALMGVEGGVSHDLRNTIYGGRAFNESEWMTTERLTMGQLAAPREVAAALLRPFLEATGYWPIYERKVAAPT